MPSAKKKSRPVLRAQYECPPIAGRVLITVKRTAEKIGCHDLTVYRHMKNIPDFPRPIKLSPGRTAFFEDEVDHYIATRPRL